MDPVAGRKRRRDSGWYPPSADRVREASKAAASAGEAGGAESHPPQPPPPKCARLSVDGARHATGGSAARAPAPLPVAARVVRPAELELPAVGEFDARWAAAAMDRERRGYTAVTYTAKSDGTTAAAAEMHIPAHVVPAEAAALNPAYWEGDRAWMADAIAFWSTGAARVQSTLLAVALLDRVASVRDLSSTTFPNWRRLVAASCLCAAIKMNSVLDWEAALSSQRPFSLGARPGDAPLSTADVWRYERHVMRALDGSFACPATVPAFVGALLGALTAHQSGVGAIATRAAAWQCACIAVLGRDHRVAKFRPSEVALAAVRYAYTAAHGVPPPAPVDDVLRAALPGADLEATAEAEAALADAATPWRSREVSPGEIAYAPGGDSGVVSLLYLIGQWCKRECGRLAATGGGAS